MSESTHAKAFSHLLRRQNALVIPMVAGRYSMLGLPDKYVAHLYWSGWIELKEPEGKLTKTQSDCHKMLAERGQNVAVVWFTSKLPLHGESVLRFWHYHLDFNGRRGIVPRGSESYSHKIIKTESIAKVAQLLTILNTCAQRKPINDGE